ncbi:MAG TPA: PEP/pyruvate-binding domain-containing protein, partial [Planctomycetota bacterium]|nr:PEP/pyruvate-binding domain-containing protein [Planctomycetota bacterium]
MLAIPSPDLLLSLFASGAQVLGLLAVAVGGVWFRKSRTNPKQRPAASPWPFRIVLLLLIGVSTAYVLTLLHHTDVENRRKRVNLVRRSVEKGKVVGNTSLKTLGFSDQLTHPLGWHTDHVAELVASGRTPVMFDVREPEEIELGYIPGARKIRYPDLKHDPSLLGDADEPLLLCDSGNRSSELADWFTTQGRKCRFMIGGYEKWVAEDRPLAEAGRRSGLRDIPDYPNKHVLLDTAEVERLVAEEGAIFVDVRYPEEFAKHALPGAINLTLRRMLTSEIEPALRSLPDRPIIAPCYDKRSSFFAMLLGLRLHRLGADFRGRYTLPHEYHVPPPDAPHIAAWRAVHEERTLLGDATAWLAAQVTDLGRALGSLLGAILLVVLAARLLLLPFTWKADRDQVALRALKPKLDELRASCAGDRAALARKTMALHREAGITPGRNLLGSLLQLVLFLALFGAVDTAVQGHATPWLWLDGLGLPDPFGVFPLVVGVLFFGLMVGGARASLRRVVLAAAVAGGVVALLWPLAAGVSIYLVASLVLLVLQRLAGALLAARRRAPEVCPPVVPLAHAAEFVEAGRKAQRLGRLLREGFPVPPGFVVCDANALQHEAGRRAILRAHGALRAATVAVRSSGRAEDGAEASHAGEFESVLQVPRERLLDTIAGVHRSLRAPNSRSAARQDDGGVIVQAMVAAEHAGVLFTEDPACAGAMLVEMTAGLGDRLVSGQVDPDAFRFGRRTFQPLQEGTAPVDLTPLLELGRRAEKLFGRPQDIEWAYAGGRFFILQARDITCTAESLASATNDPAALREAERARLLARIDRDAGSEPVFVQNELSELLPEPTPFSLALMNELWAEGGSVARAAERLGIRYAVDADSPPYAVSVFGRLYVDAREAKRRFARGIGAATALRLTRSADAIERAWREDVLPGLRRTVRRTELIDRSQMTVAELADLFADQRARFVTETYVEAEVINLAATFFTDVARKRLARRGLDPAALLGVTDGTVLTRGLFAVRTGDGLNDALAECGHRAPHDFELAAPRYREAPNELRSLLATARAGSAVARENVGLPPSLGRLDRVAVETANRFEALKEEAKHEVLRELPGLRATLLEIGRRLGLDDGVFWLLPDEVAACATADVVELHRKIAARRARHDACMAVELPSALRVADLETVASPFSAVAPAEAADGVVARGLRVAGSGTVVGRARVLRSADEIAGFEDGDVLIARFTDPRWLPLFARARGIVTEVGGWLSHAAIQAREHRLPAIVGASGVLTRVRDGDLVCLHADGTVQALPDRRRRARTRV